MTGGVVLSIASSRLLRGESEGRKVGSLLSAVRASPAEGGVDAEGGASRLEGSVDGGRLPVCYRWPVDKKGWLQDTYQFPGLA